MARGLGLRWKSRVPLWAGREAGLKCMLGSPLRAGCSVGRSAMPFKVRYSVTGFSRNRLLWSPPSCEERPACSIAGRPFERELCHCGGCRDCCTARGCNGRLRYSQLSKVAGNWSWILVATHMARLQCPASIIVGWWGFLGLTTRVLMIPFCCCGVGGWVADGVGEMGVRVGEKLMGGVSSRTVAVTIDVSFKLIIDV